MKYVQLQWFVVLALVAGCARELPPAEEFEAADGVSADVGVDVGTDEVGGTDGAAETEVGVDADADVDPDAAADGDAAGDADGDADAGDASEADGDADADVATDAAGPDVDVADADVPADVSLTCPADCTSADPCQTANCNPKTGQCETVAKPDGADCDDGEVCTGATTCLAGKCQGGKAAAPCGCVADGDCAGLDDGKLCNGTFYCNKSAAIWACQLNPGSVVTCQQPGEACKSAACLEPGSVGGDPLKAKCAIVLAEDGTPCDDGKSWTLGEACTAGQCLPSADAKLCKETSDCAGYEDGDLCNGTLFCNKALGVCQVLPKSVVHCPSAADTSCQAMQCQKASGKCQLVAKPEQAACDDGLLCTTGEACVGGVCTATVGGKTCQCAGDADCGKYEDGDACNGKLFCNLQKGKCEVNPATVVVCQTGLNTACSQAVCDKVSGACGLAVAPTATACDADGSPCTPYDHCDGGGKCVADTSVCQCTADGDCSGWEDGDLCNGMLYCEKKAGKCAVNPATVKTCASAGDSACLQNVCVALSGACSMTAVGEGGGCDDGSICTTGDKCAGGKCSSAGAVACDDGNACTSDSCDKAQGCVYSANSLACTDGDACTVGDVCKASSCFPGETAKCDDGKVCTNDSCDKAQGCVYSVNSLTCSDGDACTVGDGCKGGVCLPGAVTKCDDGNACTSDSCDKTQGCVYSANSLTCSDGDACTVGDGCKGGVCLPGAVTKCDDANPCTSDSCDKTQGCVYSANSLACSDGDACTVGDGCKGGVCLPGAVTKCDDANPCTSDSCDKTQGCVYSANSLACSDGDACTVGDGCKGGVCLAGAVTACDDGKACTGDACDKLTGCSNAPVANGQSCGVNLVCSIGACVPTCTPGQPCDDKDACTSADKCANGACSGTTVVCSDNNPCTGDSCDKGKGCVYLPSSATCTDGSACTIGDICASGTCKAGTAAVCDDGSACTTDSCDSKTGCASIAKSCNDGNSCTLDSCDKAKGCQNLPGQDGVGCGGSATCKAGICTGSGSCTEADLWSKTFGGTGNEEGRGIADAGDGGYAVVGITNSKGKGEDDFWLLRLDGAGKLLWDQTYGTTASDLANAITRTTDGGYVLAGSSWGTGLGQDDGYVVKVDKDGKLGWAKVFGGAGSDVFNGVVALVDGGVVLVGATNSSGGYGGKDAWAIRLSASGSTVWEKRLGGPNAESAVAGLALTDGGLFIVGSSQPSDKSKTDGHVWRVDALGGIVWSYGFGSKGEDAFLGVCPDGKGGLVAVGVGSKAGAALAQGWAVGLNSEADYVWNSRERHYGGTGPSALTACALGSGGQVRVVGHSQSTGGELQPWTGAIDRSGVLQWQKSYPTGTPGLLHGALPSELGVAAVGTHESAANGPEVMVMRVDGWGAASCAESGACASMAQGECDDGAVCTADLCSKGACSHVATSGSDCTAKVSCETFACQAGACVGSPKYGVAQLDGFETMAMTTGHGYAAYVGTNTKVLKVMRVEGEVVWSAPVSSSQVSIAIGKHGAIGLWAYGLNQSDICVEKFSSAGESHGLKCATPAVKDSDSWCTIKFKPDGAGLVGICQQASHFVVYDFSDHGGVTVGKLSPRTPNKDYALSAEIVSNKIVTLRAMDGVLVMDKFDMSHNLLAASEIQLGPGLWYASEWRDGLVSVASPSWSPAVITVLDMNGQVVAKVSAQNGAPLNFKSTCILRSSKISTSLVFAQTFGSSVVTTVFDDGEILKVSTKGAFLPTSAEIEGDRLNWVGQFFSGAAAAVRADIWGHQDCATSGACAAMNLESCRDGNPCTDSGCNPTTGCTLANVVTPCTDNQPCTYTDTCNSGTS